SLGQEIGPESRNMARIGPRPIPAPAAPKTASTPSTIGPDGALAPTWETQKQARTYLLGIPAPRGQIVDRNGKPLAQTRVAYNLAITFPTPLRFTDTEALAYMHQEIQRARVLLGRPLSVPDNALKHYKNRGVL